MPEPWKTMMKFYLFNLGERLFVYIFMFRELSLPGIMMLPAPGNLFAFEFEWDELPKHGRERKRSEYAGNLKL